MPARRIMGGISEEAMAMKRMGVGEAYQVRLRSWIPYLECGEELTTGSMTAHRRRMHRTDPTINWSCLTVSQTVHQPQVYNVRFPRTTKQCPCPFPGCPEFSRTWHGLRSQFNSHQWGDWVRIMEENHNPPPMWERCESRVPAGRLSNHHYMSEKCRQGEERSLRHKTLQRCFEASKVLLQTNT